MVGFCRALAQWAQVLSMLTSMDKATLLSSTCRKQLPPTQTEREGVVKRAMTLLLLITVPIYVHEMQNKILACFFLFTPKKASIIN